MSLHIVYVGNFGVSFSTETHVKRSLEALGHDVTAVQERRGCEQEARKLVRRGPVDLVLYTRTDGLHWPHERAIALWDECFRLGVATASTHLDLFHGIARRDVKTTKANALWATEYVFTADGDHQDEWAAAGINHHWLPPGVLYDECYVGTPKPEYAGDAAFVGSSSHYHDEWTRRRDLVAALESHYAGRFTRAGDGVTVREGALNDLYASVKVSAGDSLAPLRERSTYASDRIVEAPGRGSILVHPRMDPWVDLLGDAVVWSPWDVSEQIACMDEVLTWTDSKRTEHIRRAVEIVKADHTYRSRMKTLLDVVFG